MRFDALTTLVATHRPGPGIASLTRQRPTAAHAGRTHPEADASLLVAQPDGDCGQNMGPEIKREWYRDANRPSSG